MCGIAGIVSAAPSGDLPAQVRQMTERLRHRGPDDVGDFSAPGVSLGFRRLAILDLSAAGHQPMTNEDGSLHLIFNGEIYNYQSLRADLERRHHTFRSHTDSETILHAYEEYGVRCLDRLRGMFAFAVWDSRQKKLFLARDQLGKKPIVYTVRNGTLLFASELAALLAVIPKPSLNQDAIPFYFRSQSIPSPLTIYHGVQKLPPGHFLEWHDGAILIERYWTPPIGRTATIAVEDAGREVERLLREAVRVRLRSDVPLGVFLSGGLDSSILTALAAQELSTPLKTFSIGFREQSHNELPLARLIADQYRTEHHEFHIEPNVTETLPLLLRHAGEPFADSSILATYAIAKEARRVVTVALNGDGGDENFAGYEKYDTLQTLRRFDILPRPLRLAAGWMMREAAALLRGQLRRKLPVFADLLVGDLVERYSDLFFVFRRRELAALLNADPASPQHSYDELLHLRLSQLPSAPASDVSRVTALDVLAYMPETLLVKADIASMAASLEARSPFLDTDLLSFTLTLPDALKIHDGVKKYLLRRQFGHLLPQQLLHAPKHGFDLPVNDWLRGGLALYYRDRVHDGSFRSLPWFSWRSIDRLEAEHASRRAHHGIKLWALLCFAVWYQDVYRTL